MNIELRDWINDEIMPFLPVDRIRQGDKIVFRCPICGDSKKNSTKKRGYYYLKTASYHCFNCDASLSGMKLLQVFSGEDYTDVKSRFFKSMFDGKHFNSLSSASYDVQDNKQDNVLQFKSVLKPEWKNSLSEKAQTYLKERLVLSAPFRKEKFYSYYSKSGGEYILIPWKINGIDAYFQLNDFLKIGNGGLKYIFPKNKDKLIYGLDNVNINFPYLICFEGVYDSLFVPNGLAIGGKNLTDLQERILRKRFPNHKIVLSLDNDKPGLVSTSRCLSKNTFSRNLFFKWFDSSTKEKDINDFVKTQNNVNIFCDLKYVESMIIDSITMKMWLAKNGYSSNNDKVKQNRKTWKVQSRKNWDFHTIAPRKI